MLPQGHQRANRPTLLAKTSCTRNFPALPAYIEPDKRYQPQKWCTLLTATHSYPSPVEINVPSTVLLATMLLSLRSDRSYGNILNLNTI